MESHEFVDLILKGIVTLSGMGLIGLTLIRTNARGHWGLVGLDSDKLFDPRMARQGETVSWFFGIGVLLVIVRCLMQV